MYPTHIIIAPNRDIIAQDIWPVNGPGSFINPLEAAGCEAHECGSSTLTADFSADMTDPCLNDEVQFTDNSVGDVTTYTWTFEGGTPESSDEENPNVTYEAPGVYDVTLTVSDGTDEHTLLMEDYIEVSAIQASFEANNVDICDGDVVEFTSTTECTDNLTWTFEGGDPASSNEENPTVTYSAAGVYSVTLTAYNGDNELEVVEEAYITVHNCSGVGSISLNKMRVSPNPGNGLFKVSLPDNGVYEVQIYDITGQQVYYTQLSAEINQLDISHLNTGVYILNANNGTTQLKERVVIK